MRYIQKMRESKAIPHKRVTANKTSAVQESGKTELAEDPSVVPVVAGGGGGGQGMSALNRVLQVPQLTVESATGVVAQVLSVRKLRACTVVPDGRPNKK
jgi:hypothetical protein